ncbi:MAG TPA: hypothetical protein VG028_08000 [Terriglobia bacterium]|nr:hypothetical protein [Terriglobia bacterium]
MRLCNSPPQQARGAAFELLPLKLDAEKIAASPIDQDIAAGDSSARVLVVQAREDWAIAPAGADP